MAPKGPIVPIVCPLCKESFKLTTMFASHVAEIHHTTEHELYDKTFGIRQCQCGCGQVTNWVGWKKGYTTCIIGHNAYLYSYCQSTEERDRLVKTRADSMKKNGGWKKGLTKETDERIAAGAKKISIIRKKAFDEGRLVAWNKGLTKETDQRVKDAADDIKQGFASGARVAWHKGLTKETDERVAALGAAVSSKLRETDVRKRLDELKKFSIEEVKKRIDESGQLELIGGYQEYVNYMTKCLRVRCKKCGHEETTSLRSSTRCRSCAPGGSIAQTNVFHFVKSLIGDAEYNVRSILNGGKELDIWIPSKKFAIEYNGLYFHSDVQKASIYHQMKTEDCIKRGISLFHIFEDEWRDKQDIVKSMIKSRLGLLPHKIYARKCSIVELSTSDRMTFFENNHLDGDVPATASWGLIAPDGSLVGALSVRKPFHKSLSDVLEVARVCSRMDTSVVGGLGKLTQHAKNYAITQNKSGLMTYVDQRLGPITKSYAKAGWQLIKETSQRFWWTDFENRFNRFKFKADKSNGLTEKDVAGEAGVVKIWGCKNAVYRI